MTLADAVYQAALRQLKRNAPKEAKRHQVWQGCYGPTAVEPLVWPFDAYGRFVMAPAPAPTPTGARL